MEFTKPDFMKNRMATMQHKKEVADSGGGGDRSFLFSKQFPFYKYRDGENVVRLIESTFDAKMLSWFEGWVHYGVGPSDSQCFCLRLMVGQKCPECEVADQEKQAGVENKDNTHFAKARSWSWIIDRKDESKGVQLMSMPGCHYNPYTKKQMGFTYDLFNRCRNRKTGDFLNIVDPKEGRDISFIKAGSGKTGTTYSNIDKDDENSPLSTNETSLNEWFKFCEENPLPKFLNILTYDSMKAIIEGTTGGVLGGTSSLSEKTEVKESTPEVKKEEVKSEVKESKPEPTKSETVSLTGPIDKDTLGKLSHDALIQLIESRSLAVNPEEWSNDDELRQAIELMISIS